MSENVPVSEKIRRARRAKELSQEELDDALGVPHGRTFSYEKGRAAAPEVMVRRIAKILSVDPFWFFDGEDTPPHAGETFFGTATPGMDPPSPIGERGAVPGAGRRWFPIRFFVGASAHPVDGKVDGEDFEEFSDRLYRPERYCVIVVGDSGEPRIRHGDILLIQPHPSAKNGVLNVFTNESGETLVKVARGDDSGGWKFAPVNPDFPDMAPEDGTACLGYVVGLKRNRGRDGYIEEGENAGIRP